MKGFVSVVVVGAGPYGLSIAAHLSALGVDFRILGESMQTWREAMPPGMLLKSEGFASNLHDPDGAFTLEAYCRERGAPYAPVGLPVPAETFIAYGQAFQQRFAPDLIRQTVTRLSPVEGGFELATDAGETICARRVVVATGIRRYGHIPEPLSSLPAELVSHSSLYGGLGPLEGRKVIVVGAGASAVDLAAALEGRAASVTIVARTPAIRFHGPPRRRTWADDLRHPMTGLGPGWRSWFAVHAPLVFHAMPKAFRLEVVRRHLGPAPGWFMRERMDGRVDRRLGVRIVEARAEGGRARLVLAGADGGSEVLEADHVVAATGYRVDPRRLGFLGPDLLARLRLAGASPALSTGFECSVPGLFFVGANAADSFGPLLRFAFGAGFTARRLSLRLARAF